MNDNQPLTHSRSFRVRHYECDALGHLNNANYVRYMQETAFDASAAAGYDHSKYEQIGHSWLIRETDIEYLKPVGYGDSVNVKTWVIDFHRVRSRRAYEFSLLGSGEKVAKAVTDWVFLDSATAKPTTIPDEMIDAFFPDGLPANTPPRQKFSIPPNPPDGKFETNLRVNWNDLDPVQHVNNAVYLNFVEECGMQVIASHGWPITRMIDEGFAIFIRQHQIQYRQPAFLGDELVISTWASNVRRSTATRHYVIQRSSDGTEMEAVHSLGVWVDLKSGKPIRIPKEFLSDFAPNIVD
jgi:acyl-CoA thioester hydrolase